MRCSSDPLCTGYTLNINSNIAKLMTGTLTGISRSQHHHCYFKPNIYYREDTRGFCAPDTDEYYLCSEASLNPPLPGTCEGSTTVYGTSGWFDSDHCDEHCTRMRCSLDPLCTGYTMHTGSRNTRLQTGPVTGVWSNTQYHCYFKSNIYHQDTRGSCLPETSSGTGPGAFLTSRQETANLCEEPYLSERALPGTCASMHSAPSVLVNDHIGFLGSDCDHSCAQMKCSRDPSCLGYDWDTQDNLARLITGTQTGTGTVMHMPRPSSPVPSPYKCFVKPNWDTELILDVGFQYFL